MEADVLAISMDAAAAMLDIGRDAVREGIRSGAIPSLQVGKHIKVCLPALTRLLNGEAVDENAIARQVHLSQLQSSLLLMDAQRAEIKRQIADLEQIGAASQLNEFLYTSRRRRRYRTVELDEVTG